MDNCCLQLLISILLFHCAETTTSLCISQEDSNASVFAPAHCLCTALQCRFCTKERIPLITQHYAAFLRTLCFPFAIFAVVLRLLSSICTHLHTRSETCDWWQRPWCECDARAQNSILQPFALCTLQKSRAMCVCNGHLTCSCSLFLLFFVFDNPNRKR